MNLVCPKCGKPFGEDDVNVRTDVAHCRGCGMDFSYVSLKENEKYLKALHESPPKHFKSELTDRGIGWGDLRLAYYNGTFRKSLYLVFVLLLLVLGIGGVFYPWSAENRELAFVLPVTAAPIVLLLTGIAASVQRTLEVEMKGGKGCVWAYWLFRGKGRAFEYTGETEIGLHGATGFKGQPVMDKFMIANPQQKPLVFRVIMSENDAMFLQAALLYALPKDESWFEPEPDLPETPEEAAARRVEEANAVSAAKWAKWRWLKFVAIVAALVGLRIGLEHMDRRKSSVKEHQVRLLRAFAEGGDYWAVAREMPVRAPKSYQERMYKDLAKFDAVTFLYRDFQATEEWNREELDDFVSRCVAVTNRLGTKKTSAAYDIVLGRCMALIECCQRAKAALAAAAGTNDQLKIKVDFKAKEETCTEKERNL